MINQFSRTQMLIGKDNLEKLSNSNVIVFGIGGVGSYVIEALARCGIGRIDIVDNDKISITNINRQIIALNSNIGNYKVDVAKHRLLDINPNIKTEAFNVFYNKETNSLFNFTKYDYVIDAIDSVSSKIALIEKCTKLNIPIISSMGTGNKINSTMLEVSDIYKTSVCPLARVIRQELKKRNIKKLKVVYSKEIPIKPIENSNEITTKRTIPASISFVPSTAGLIIASEVIKDLINLNQSVKTQ